MISLVEAYGLESIKSISAINFQYRGEYAVKTFYIFKLSHGYMFSRLN